MTQTAPDLNLKQNEVFSVVEGHDCDVLLADDGKDVDLLVEGEARLQAVVTLQHERGLDPPPGPQRLVHILVQQQLQTV